MSVIKEIYDLAKDTAALTTKAAALKRALKAELKLNKKILEDIQCSAAIDNEPPLARICNPCPLTIVSPLARAYCSYHKNRSTSETLAPARGKKRKVYKM